MRVGAGRTALMAFLTAHVGVLGFGTSGRANMVLGGTAFSVRLGMRFGLRTLGAGCTFLFTSATPACFLLRGRRGTSSRARVALLAV